MEMLSILEDVEKDDGVLQTGEVSDLESAEMCSEVSATLMVEISLLLVPSMKRRVVEDGEVKR